VLGLLLALLAVEVYFPCNLGLHLRVAEQYPVYDIFDHATVLFGNRLSFIVSYEHTGALFFAHGARHLVELEPLFEHTVPAYKIVVTNLRDGKVLDLFRADHALHCFLVDLLDWLAGANRVNLVVIVMKPFGHFHF
jgi:hypothetical protein